MADPTLSDVMASLTAIRSDLATVKLQNQQQTGLLIALTNGVQIMSQIATDTSAAVATQNAKIETLLGLVLPALDGLRAANAALQTQVDALKAGDTADAATLQATIDASTAETARVQAAIDALTPPPSTP
jgi:hypothetical protein